MITNKMQQVIDEKLHTTAKLGFQYEPTATTFRIWAPTIKSAKVVLYQTAEHAHNFSPTKDGVWEVEVVGNLEAVNYRFEITHEDNHVRLTTDPYGVASTANGEFSTVVDLTKTKNVRSLSPRIAQPTDAIIYEVNVRDFTIHQTSPTVHKGQYLGLAEIDHLKDLGITHIQLLPIYDFEGIDELDPLTSYNWGYNPSQYNVPEGSYATNPNDPYARINELKTLIDTLHAKGLYVIMDVVYNHVYETKTHPFNAVTPGYYYRYDADGNQIEGSGCGSDVASERMMPRQYIVDSVKFWINEYGIDGFRFDLMGLHDVETMNAVRAACDAIDPSIMVYGEGWHIATGIPEETQASMNNADQMPKIAHFNDVFRNVLKGSNWDEEPGLIAGNFDAMQTGLEILAGSTDLTVETNLNISEPIQTVNYVECHDDHTFWDRLKISNPNETDATLRQRHLLATAMTIFAQGIPFIHGGQEFFRTKGGIKNSYQSPDDVNAINWDEVAQYESEMALVSGWLKIRKSHGAFRFATANLIAKHLTVSNPETGIILYHLQDVSSYGPYDEIKIYFNLNTTAVKITDDLSSFGLIANDVRSGIDVFIAGSTVSTLTPLSTTIAIKNRVYH